MCDEDSTFRIPLINFRSHANAWLVDVDDGFPVIIRLLVGNRRSAAYGRACQSTSLRNELGAHSQITLVHRCA